MLSSDSSRMLPPSENSSKMYLCSFKQLQNLPMSNNSSRMYPILIVSALGCTEYPWFREIYCTGNPLTRLTRMNFTDILLLNRWKKECNKNIFIAWTYFLKPDFPHFRIGIAALTIHVSANFRKVYRICTTYVWQHGFRKAWISGAMLFGEVAWFKVFFIALSVCKHFCFSSFYPYLTWFALAHPPFIFLVKALATARKSLRGFRKLSRHDQALTKMQIYAFI